VTDRKEPSLPGARLGLAPGRADNVINWFALQRYAN
jgi:hypothetical protein